MRKIYLPPGHCRWNNYIIKPFIYRICNHYRAIGFYDWTSLETFGHGLALPIVNTSVAMVCTYLGVLLLQYISEEREKGVSGLHLDITLLLRFLKMFSGRPTVSNWVVKGDT